MIIVAEQWVEVVPDAVVDPFIAAMRENGARDGAQLALSDTRSTLALTVDFRNLLRSIAMATTGTLLIERGWLEPSARKLDIELCSLVIADSSEWWEKVPDTPKPSPRVMELFEATTEFVEWFVGQLGNGDGESGEPEKALV